MLNTQIEFIASNHTHTAPYFRGVFASDTLPSSITDDPPYFIITNTAPSRVKGVHWVLLYRNKDFSTTYFDSLGQAPMGDILGFLKSLGQYHVTPYRYQPYNSSSCGQFCLYFADLRCCGFNSDQIEKTFSKTNLHSNDCLVTTYVYSHMINHEML